GDIDGEFTLEQLYEIVANVKTEQQKEIKKLKVDLTKPEAIYKQFNINDAKSSSDDALENMLMEMMRSILTNPVHLDEVLSPVDSDTAKNLKEISTKLLTGNANMINKLQANDVRTEQILAMRNKVGLQGVGIYATQMTGASVAEFTSSNVNEKYAFKLKTGNKSKVYNAINRVVDDNGVSIIYSFSKHLTMSVDNAKDPLMTFLNDNPFTSGETSLLIRSGAVDKSV